MNGVLVAAVVVLAVIGCLVAAVLISISGPKS